MEKVKYDVGFGVVIDSFTCSKCRYNVTDEKTLDKTRQSAAREKIKFN